MARTVGGCGAALVGALGPPFPEPRLDGLTVGLLRQAPELGDGRETEASDAAEAWVADLERLGARVVEADAPRRFSRHVAGVPARGCDQPCETFPARADEYGHVMRRSWSSPEG